jgi:subtilisin-like proprotein convertase family protein
MQPKFTQWCLRSFHVRIFVMALVLVSLANVSKSQVLFSEGFNTVVPLPAGWSTQNNSSPVGGLSWFQGNAGVFPAQSGAATAYIAVNFNSGGGLATISNWLITPNVTMTDGDEFTFWTRCPTGGGVFPDRLQVRLSANGASTNVGATATSVGDFTNLLLDINPTYSTTAYPEVWTQFTVTISGLGTPTSGRLAFRYFVENGGPSGANSNYIGIDEAVYTKLPPCTGTPAPGNTVSTANPVCAGVNFTLSVQNPPINSGISYVWEESPNGTSWTVIAGANQSTLVRQQSTTTWYRAHITCSAGPSTGTSTPIQVTMAPASSCYCAAGATATVDEKISRVRYASIDNSSNSTAGYENFLNVSTTVIQGSTLPMTVDISNFFSGDQVKVWIDLNQNGNFTDPGELVLTTPANQANPLNGNITIPVASTLGPTRMRVRMYWAPSDPNPGPCGNTAFGQVEDYTVNIAPCIQGVWTTHPSNTSTQCSGTASFTAAASGSLITYAWEMRPNSSAPWQNVPNSPPFSNINTGTLTLSNVPSTYNGWQFRALMSGACTAIDFSNSATLTVTPLVAAVTPASANICTGTIQQLSLTNASSQVTTTFNATGLPLAIPDNNPTGTSNTIVASGLPASPVVTNVSVTFTMTHTWVGDIVMNLTAPNGQTINLVGALDGGTGSNGTANFTGTIISSTGTTPLSGAPAPRTGVFAADLLTAAIPTGAPTTTNSWAPLIAGALNGNWRLAICDVGPADLGNLLSWSLSLTYGAPAAGVWTSNPAAPNTMFTDPGATVPYVAGTPVNTIYVNPTVNTVYTVVYTTATPCVSGPTNVPVNVFNPVVGPAVTPTTRAVCLNGSTTFTATATSGGPFTYQWEVSTNDGLTWTPIAGATGQTLTLDGVTQLMNNFRYRVVTTAGPCGSATTSTFGLLTINQLPVVTLSSPQLTLVPGQSTTITATSTPAAAPNGWSWTLNGNPVLDASGNPVTTNSIIVDIDDLGSYVATVTDINGCTASSADALVVGANPSDRLWIFPNPSPDGHFQVRYFNSNSPTERRVLKVFNTSGVMIKEQVYTLDQTMSPFHRMDVDMSAQAAGIYLVQVFDKFGAKVAGGFVVVR